MSRREAARLLGFASEFPIRKLEKEGRLRSVRGALGQAWYPRQAVLALAAGPESTRGPGVPDRAPAAHAPQPARGWSDAALIGLLRELTPARNPGASDGAVRRPRTVVDLVADTGISIARATRIHRFWLAHDQHPVAELARAGSAPPSPRRRPATLTPPAAVAGQQLPPTAAGAGPIPETPGGSGATAERRGSERLERERLIRRLRDPDPAVRAMAFEKLRPRQPPP